MSVFSFLGFQESCLLNVCPWILRHFFRSLGGRSNLIRFARVLLDVLRAKHTNRVGLFKGRYFWKVSWEAALGKAMDSGSQGGGAEGQPGTWSPWRGRLSVHLSAIAHTPHAGDSTQRSAPMVTTKQQVQSNHVTHFCWEREDRHLIPLVKELSLTNYLCFNGWVENILMYDY